MNSLRTPSRWFRLATSLAAACIASTIAAAPPATADPVTPTVVLVHGAFADSTTWTAVTAQLADAGIPFRTFDTPLRSVPGDAAALTDFLARIDGPIVLVAHSYGGAVISNVHDPDVRANVFVAAFAPAQGEPLVQLLLDPAQFPGTLLLPPALLAAPVLDSTSPIGVGVDGFVLQPFFRPVFAQDVSPTVAAELFAHQKTAAVGANLEPSGPPSWASVPSWYLVSTEDRVIAPAMQRKMAGRAAPGRTEEVVSSHVSPVSRPDRVTAIVREAIAATS